MKIKALITALGLAIALPFTAAAHDKEAKAEDITRALNLDRTRAQQVEQIFDNYNTQHKLLKEQKEDQLETVLTDAEMERVKAMKKAKKEERKRN